MATNVPVYAWFEKLEERVANTYFLFQQKFIENPRLAKFWTEAALEELQHASILRFCCEHRLITTLEVNQTDSERVTETLEMVNAVADAQDLTIDQAFFAALLIESSGLDRIFMQLIQALARSHYVLYTAIQASLRSHHEALAQAALAFVHDRALANGFRSVTNNLSR